MAPAGQDISLGEFVKQLAALLQKKDVRLPFKRQELWHQLFYDLKKQAGAPGRPKFLDDLVFDWDAPYSKSQQLAEFLNALHFTASGSVRNPHFDVISVDSELADRWVKTAEEEKPDLRGFVEAAAQLAERELIN